MQPDHMQGNDLPKRSAYKHSQAKEVCSARSAQQKLLLYRPPSESADKCANVLYKVLPRQQSTQTGKALFAARAKTAKACAAYTTAAATQGRASCYARIQHAKELCSKGQPRLLN